jgi:hypothetical protein
MPESPYTEWNLDVAVHPVSRVRETSREINV